MSTDVGNLCGSLLAGITQARILSDIEAVRTAEFYAQHPLLKHLPVPRMRCSEVTLDVPIVIEDVEDLTGGADLGTLARAGGRVPEDAETDEAVDDAVRFSGLELEPSEVKQLKKAVRQRNKGLRTAPRGVRRTRRVAAEIGDALREPLKALAAAREDDEEAPRKFGKLVSAFEMGVRERSGEDLQKLNRVRVRAKTSELSQVPDSSLVVRMRMTVSEEGYEMTFGESDDGNVVESFTPE